MPDVSITVPGGRVELLTAVLPVATGVLTASGAFLGVWVTVRQRGAADRREEWWRRFSWAADLVLDGSADKRAHGLAIMAGLAESSLVGPDEARLLDVFHTELLPIDSYRRPDPPAAGADTGDAARQGLGHD